MDIATVCILDYTTLKDAKDDLECRVKYPSICSIMGRPSCDNWASHISLAPKAFSFPAMVPLSKLAIELVGSRQGDYPFMPATYFRGVQCILVSLHKVGIAAAGKRSAVFRITCVGFRV